MWTKRRQILGVVDETEENFAFFFDLWTKRRQNFRFVDETVKKVQKFTLIFAEIVLFRKNSVLTFVIGKGGKPAPPSRKSAGRLQIGRLSRKIGRTFFTSLKHPLRLQRRCCGLSKSVLGATDSGSLSFKAGFAPANSGSQSIYPRSCGDGGGGVAVFSAVIYSNRYSIISFRHCT